MQHTKLDDGWDNDGATMCRDNVVTVTEVCINISMIMLFNVAMFQSSPHTAATPNHGGWAGTGYDTCVIIHGGK